MSRLVPPMGFALATLRVGLSREKIRYMYRELPDKPEDGGWRFFSGDEEQGYVDSPDNIRIYDVNTIAEMDPSIVPLLHRDPPCAFERKTGSDPFHEVDRPLPK